MIGIIGSGDSSVRHDTKAEEVGRLLGNHGAVLVCGGLSGMMEAASRGCRSSGGETIGFLPGSDKKDANPYIGFPIPTGMGIARNVLVIRASDAVIALSGSHGTMSEIALALNIGKPVIDLGNWGIGGMLAAGSAGEAVSLALEKAAGPGGGDTARTG